MRKLTLGVASLVGALSLASAGATSAACWSGSLTTLTGKDANLTTQSLSTITQGGAEYPNHVDNGWDSNASAFTPMSLDSNCALYVDIVNAGIQLLGTLPPFASPPTVNLGNLNGAATSALQTAMIAALGNPLQANGNVNVSNLPALQATKEEDSSGADATDTTNHAVRVHVVAGGTTTDTTSSGTLNAATTAGTPFTLALGAGQPTAAVTVNGLTASGATLAVTWSADGGNTWTAVNEFTTNGVIGNTISVDGQYRFSTAGRGLVRIAVATTGTGTVTLNAEVSSGVGPISIIGSLPPGSNLIGGVNCITGCGITGPVLSSTSAPPTIPLGTQSSAGLDQYQDLRTIQVDPTTGLPVNPNTTVPINLSGVTSLSSQPTGSQTCVVYKSAPNALFYHVGGYSSGPEWIVILNAASAPTSGTAVTPIRFGYIGSAGNWSIDALTPLSLSNGLTVCATAATTPYTYTTPTQTTYFDGAQFQ